MKLAEVQENFLNAAERPGSAGLVAAAASHVRHPLCLSHI